MPRRRLAVTPALIAFFLAMGALAGCSGPSVPIPAEAAASGSAGPAAASPADGPSPSIASESPAGGDEDDDDDAPVPTPSPLPANNGGSLVDAARAVTDACAVTPMDLIAPLVPGASSSQASASPSRCTVTNQVQTVEITIAPDDAVDAPAQAETVSDLGVAAYLQTKGPDDAVLKVVLDPSGGAIYVHVAGHDGRDHAEDAVAIARAVLARLGA